MSNGKKTLAQEFSVLFNLPWYIFLIFGAIVVAAAYMGVLPQGMAGCFAFMIVLFFLFPAHMSVVCHHRFTVNHGLAVDAQQLGKPLRNF